MSSEAHSYFDEVERDLRAAIRSGAHLPQPARRSHGNAARAAGDRLSRLARAVRPLPSASALRGGRLRSGRAAVAVSVATIAAAASVLAIVGVGGGTQSAFAGWSAAPTPARPGEQAAAEAACKVAFRRTTKLERALYARELHLDQELIRAAGLQARGALPELQIRRIPRKRGQMPQPPNVIGPNVRWHTVAVDDRGPYTLLVLRAKRQRETCLSGPSSSGARQAFDIGFRHSEGEAPRLDGIAETAGGFAVLGRNRGALSYAIGRAGKDVTGVTIEFAGGQHVIATTTKGWFLAWWPNARIPLAAQIATTSGVRSQRPFYPPAQAQG